jgi:F-type H+-transporting ATPase subunit b
MLDLLSHNTDIWYALAFVIFALIAWRYGAPAALGALDAQIAAIRREIAAAEDLRVEAQELLARYERKQRDAAKEARKIVDGAQANAAQYEAQAARDLADAIEQRRRRLAERVALMRAAALADIRGYGAGIVADRARALLADKISKKAAGELIDRSTSRIARLAA